MKAFGWFSEVYDEVKSTFEFKLKTFELEITENIIALMKKRQISRTELAAKLETSKPAVSKFLNDGSNITIKRLLKIADALDCHLKLDLVPAEQAVSTVKVVAMAMPANVENLSSRYWQISVRNSNETRWSADQYSGYIAGMESDADAA
jgi:transcriptional regulator with XRE-family HTH domain